MDILQARLNVQKAVNDLLKQEIMPIVFVQRTKLSAVTQRTILVLPLDQQEYFAEVWNDYEFFKHFEMEELEDYVLDKFPEQNWQVFKLETMV